MTTSPITTADQLKPVLSRLADVVDGVSEQRLDAQTPCHDWDVAALRDHVARWLTTFADGYADPDGKAPDASALSVEPTGATVRAAAAKLDEAVRSGAGDRALWLGQSSMPGDMALSMILWEYVVHGWDLARGTGQDWRPNGGAVDASLEFAPGMLSPDYQGEGKAFAPRVDIPKDAPSLDRLLGLSGRDPSWLPER
ncbi:MAG: TIGR03086 family metal-binding protein [Mycobacteriales bacterium]